MGKRPEGSQPPRRRRLRPRPTVEPAAAASHSGAPTAPNLNTDDLSRRLSELGGPGMYVSFSAAPPSTPTLTRLALCGGAASTVKRCLHDLGPPVATTPTGVVCPSTEPTTEAVSTIPALPNTSITTAIVPGYTVVMALTGRKARTDTCTMWPRGGLWSVMISDRRSPRTLCTTKAACSAARPPTKVWERTRPRTVIGMVSGDGLDPHTGRLLALVLVHLRLATAAAACMCTAAADGMRLWAPTGAMATLKGTTDMSTASQ